MDLPQITQTLNQYLTQYFDTQLPEEAVPYVLGGSALAILLFIVGLVWLVRRKGKTEDQAAPTPAEPSAKAKGRGKKGKATSSELEEPMVDKATAKKLAKLEKAQLKQQKEEDKERDELRKKKEAEQLAKMEKEQAELQEILAQKELERSDQQTLKKGLASESEPEPEPTSFLDRLKKGMSKTRGNLVGGVANLVLGKKEIDEDLLDDLEELLFTADIGPETTNRILESITAKVQRNELKDPEALQDAVKEEIIKIMDKAETFPTTKDKKPLVLLFVGVNGVGKTTTIGKISSQYVKEGKKVLMGAGDTFRAAAIEQLAEWSGRAKCDIVTRDFGSDPSSVMYATVEKAVNENYDVVICDTAGRLQNKKNLMDELEKMVRVIRKVVPDAPHEVLLVLDATTGQNAILQVREFSKIADVTGLVITKLDGTAKGGVVIGIVNEFDIPVRYIGVGEGIDDLRPFNAHDYTQSLFE